MRDSLCWRCCWCLSSFLAFAVVCRGIQFYWYSIYLLTSAARTTSRGCGGGEVSIFCVRACGLCECLFGCLLVRFKREREMRRGKKWEWMDRRARVYVCACACVCGWVGVGVGGVLKMVLFSLPGVFSVAEDWLSIHNIRITKVYSKIDSLCWCCFFSLEGKGGKKAMAVTGDKKANSRREVVREDERLCFITRVCVWVCGCVRVGGKVGGNGVRCGSE